MTSTVPSCLSYQPLIFNPPHLEGDPALATEILPGPPSLQSIQQHAKKSEGKPPLPPKNFLPPSDPGTTYMGLAGGMIALAEDGSRSRKRARLGRTQSNRAQRLSGRALTGYIPESSGVIMEADHALLDSTDGFLVQDDDNSSSNSRSASCQPESAGTLDILSGDVPTLNLKEKRKADRNGLNITTDKEEPVFQHPPEVSKSSAANEDHCSSCNSFGALVYCDGCPRAFHLWCLDPPVDPADFPDEERWFCPSCKPPPKKSKTSFPSLLSPLVRQIDSALPAEFRLPDQMRNFFRDVGTGLTGAYVDTSSKKVQRLGRHGLAEDRDPHRLKDNRNNAVICFHCGKTALPANDGNILVLSEPGPSSGKLQTSWKNIVSCDFCPLHWHIDCLEPPLTALPSSSRKWKCPNHALNALPKIRTPRTLQSPIDVTETRKRNNGNIEVINTELPDRLQEDMNVDEILINGRKYRVPERIIVLDFWNALRRNDVSQNDGGALSPLTSLSSLNDDSGDDRSQHMTSASRSTSPISLSEAAEALSSFHDHPRLRSVSSASKMEVRSRSQSTGTDGNSDGVADFGMDDFAGRQNRIRRTDMTPRTWAPLNLRNTDDVFPNYSMRPDKHLVHDSVGRRAHQLEGHVDLAEHANGVDIRQAPRTIKSSGSPLKIRIPGRLLQRSKQGPDASRKSIESSVSSTTSSTRRSRRNQALPDIKPL